MKKTAAKKVDLTTKIKNLTFKNPVTVASGTFGTTTEMESFIDYDKLGAVIAKTVTLYARPGNPMPRICETASGMINAIGLQNKGLDEFLENKMPKIRKQKTPWVISIAAETTEEFSVMAKKLDAVKKDFAMLEVNLSCPNVEKGGASFVKKQETIIDIIKAIRDQTDMVMMAKLSPELGDVIEIAGNALRHGADGLSLINTLRGMVVDVYKRRSRIARDSGGLSGPAIKPVALRYVYDCKKAFNCPIIASGGIRDWKDAVEFLIVGADLLAVGTSNFVTPNATMQIITGIESFCREQGIQKLDDLRGTFQSAQSLGCK
ncbi:MAG TPA: dihydroorotate dehydrogenase [Candidatus Omnitrophota bacterium]|mgnify:FL=1|nr:dihydroorotate dehydrogenase [Candidatus Omnitrophota bacterium]